MPSPSPPRIKPRHPFLMHPLMNGRSRSPSPSRRSHTALVVINVQVGVVATCVDVKGVISRISSLVSRARDAGAPVVWVQHEDGGLARDSKEWGLAPGLPEPLDDEVRVYKRFRDSFTAPELEEELHARGVRHLVLVGAQSDYCVRTTAQSAAVRGYAVTVPRDAHTTEDAEFGGTTISAQQIVQHTNAYFDDFEYQPGVRCRNVAAHEVEFLRR
ncbi:Isochorismatase hydrolase [Cutaneotrichosporon oleaginosum]|uniref:Isochorismatase hydrolase n=1 Tax=Cutaneotrichosporon oleaginosum TaxID=879819 RepID=A0A0J0XZD2_9TREE|nr:Isochorismatase hydrolase [Cutaneotrichosporon oleaginosum]KLT46392.1 Isochorismatase hydrolase [Cutaneotrichosporon oleaginosum]TXT15238.1 hypothetical protein COLE_01431 [Cutaneotrichosporon oleaginosum]